MINTELGFYRRSEKATKELGKLFTKFNLKPIKWLHAARKELKIVKLDKSKTGKHTVYTILLHFPPKMRRAKDRYGVYVGQTSKTALERYLTHKDPKDFTSRPQPRKYGIEILRSLTPQLPEKGLDESYSKDLEHQIAKRLKKTKFEPKGLPPFNVKGGH